MKFLFSKMTSFVGFWGITFFVITYIFEKQWENALCWGCCLALFVACRYYEEKAEELEMFNKFLMGKKCGEVSDGISKIMADALMNVGGNKPNGNGKEQE